MASQRYATRVLYILRLTYELPALLPAVLHFATLCSAPLRERFQPPYLACRRWYVLTLVGAVIALYRCDVKPPSSLRRTRHTLRYLITVRSSLTTIMNRSNYTGRKSVTRLLFGGVQFPSAVIVGSVQRSLESDCN